MVRAGCTVVIVKVTIDAFDTKRAKIKQCGRCIGMAVVTIGSDMRPDQREPAPLMQFRNVVHNPGSGCMTAAAIGSHGLIVHVGVARNALGSRFGKLQRCVAQPACNNLVLPNQRKLGRTMVEGKGFHVNFPACGAVAIHAVHLKTAAMRR